MATLNDQVFDSGLTFPNTGSIAVMVIPELN